MPVTPISPVPVLCRPLRVHKAARVSPPGLQGQTTSAAIFRSVPSSLSKTQTVSFGEPQGSPIFCPKTTARLSISLKSQLPFIIPLFDITHQVDSGFWRVQRCHCSKKEDHQDRLGGGNHQRHVKYSGKHIA